MILKLTIESDGEVVSVEADIRPSYLHLPLSELMARVVYPAVAQIVNEANQKNFDNPAP